MKPYGPLLALALLASPAFGQSPPPAKALAQSRSSYPSGSVVFVNAAGSVSAWPLQFAVVGKPDEPKSTLDGGMGAIFPGLVDGQYFIAVTASGPVDGKPPAIDTAVVAVTVGPVPKPTPTDDPTLASKIDELSATVSTGLAQIIAKLDAIPAPAPVPPTPTPPPAPPGFAGHVHATLVFDLDEPSTALLRASTVKAEMKALGADWYVAPTAGPVAKLFASYTTADGLPTVYFTDDAGKMLGTLKAPTTKDQVVAKMKAIRGGTN